MKTAVTILAAALSAHFCSQAQETKGGQALVEIQTMKRETKPVLRPSMKTIDTLFGREVTYGGFVPEVLRSPKPGKELDLRKPIHPTQDTNNISYYPRSERVQGFVLFSVKF